MTRGFVLVACSLARSSVLRIASSAWPWLVAALCAAAFALTFGLNYPLDNQFVYFLSALRQLDPTTLARDWYATEVTHYHPAITVLVTPLLKWFPSGWAIAALQMVVIVSSSLAWLAVCHRLVRHRWTALVAFVLTFSLITCTHALSVGTSYLFNEAFQPSTMGTWGLLFAIAAFVAERWLISGTMLGLAGLFHANYLVLDLAAFGLAHLVLAGWALRGGLDRAKLRLLALRMVFQFGPSVVALALLVAPMLATVASDHAAEAQRILFEIRSPHHYYPRSFSRDFLPFSCWLVLGVVSSQVLPKTEALRRLIVWTLATAAVVWAGSVFTTWEYVARVAQLFVWRIAPFVDLVGQGLFCLGLVHVMWRPAHWRRWSLRDLCLLLVSVCGLVTAAGLAGNEGLAEVLSLTLGLGVLLGGVRFAVDHRWGRSGRRGLLTTVRTGLAVAALLGCSGVFAWAAWPRLKDLERSSNLLHQMGAHDRQLYEWVAANTSRDARFLSPPGHEAFRYISQRAIVVDWKATPMLPDEVIEWYHRVQDVVGRPVRSGRDLVGYSQLDVNRVRSLKTKYGFEYVLVRRGPHARLRSLSQVYANSRWVIFDVRQL